MLHRVIRYIKYNKTYRLILRVEPLKTPSIDSLSQ